MTKKQTDGYEVECFLFFGGARSCTYHCSLELRATGVTGVHNCSSKVLRGRERGGQWCVCM